MTGTFPKLCFFSHILNFGTNLGISQEQIFFVYTFVKTVFSDPDEVPKRKDRTKIPKVIFHIKTIPSHMIRM